MYIELQIPLYASKTTRYVSASWVSLDMFTVCIGIHGSAQCGIQPRRYLCTIKKDK